MLRTLIYTHQLSIDFSPSARTIAPYSSVMFSGSCFFVLFNSVLPVNSTKKTKKGLRRAFQRKRCANDQVPF